MIAGRQCDEEPRAWVTFVGFAGGQERYAVCWSHLYGLEFVTGQETVTSVQQKAERGLSYALAGHRYTKRAVAS